MRWNKFRIKTKAEAEDLISSMLSDLGIEGIEIEDHIPLTAREKEQMFVDILPESEVDDGSAYISFYLEEDIPKQVLLEQVKQELEELRTFVDVGEASIEESQTEDLDWINNWKQYFKQFYIDDILVIPSWEEVKAEDQDKLILHIDPGTAFGTGMHETTQLCIRQIKKYIQPDSQFLDVGTGSGILSIAALKLGAGYVVGTDLDPCAITAVKENMQENGIAAADYKVYQGNLITEEQLQQEIGTEYYDMAAANILADVLIPLSPVLADQLKKGGIYITSGIINTKEDEVRDAVAAAGFNILEVTYQGEWVSITARKR